MMSYNKPGWEVVRLADSLSNTDTDDGISIIDKTYIPAFVDNAKATVPVKVNDAVEL